MTGSAIVEQPTLLTAKGYERLVAELRHLRTVRRLEVAQRLRQAAEDGGDLTENFAYEDAKDEQAFVEGRILELQQILANPQIIPDTSGPSDRVALGSVVTVQEDGGPPETYHLVGTVEANPRGGNISDESPLGRALLGHEVGDTVTFATPDGPLTVTITDIA
jgi:transcription elongation factor GreA